VPSSGKKRARSANRARTTLPRKRRATANQVLARRGMIILGIVVAGSLVVALLSSTSSTSQGSTPTAALSSQSDPSQLIRAVTANPNDSDSLGALADYDNQTGQQQQALTLYQKYITLRPDDARARVTLAELLIGSGNLAAAQSQLVQAISFASATTDPQTTARAHLDLGDVYTALQPPRQNDALAEYKQASDLDPSGDVGDQARTKLAALQQQLNVATVSAVAPGAPASGAAGTPPARPTGTP
jgi:tetratricopeptide (TPR) repeat protein